MLRLDTQVTSSPTAALRSSSASAATARTSGPRAPNRVTISLTPTSWPFRTPASTSPTAPPAVAWAAGVPFEPGEARIIGGEASAPEYQPASSGRPRPSASLRSSTGNLMSASSHRSGSRAYSGYTVSRGARANPLASVTVRRRSRAGQGRSGFTWSAVMGETPPQSSMPASSSSPKSSDRLGGPWRWISSGRMRRAKAMASRYSS